MGKYYRHPKFGRVYGNTLPTPIGRLCWPALVTPKEDNYQGKVTLRYGITVLIDKEDPKTLAFKEKLDTMLDEEGGMLAIFNEHADVNISLSGEVLKDGDEFDQEKYPYYAGKYVILARNEKQIPVYGPSGSEEILDPSVIHGGVLGRVVLTPHLGPSGVSFKAEAVQYYKDDGVRFGGSVRNINAFLDAIKDDDDMGPEATEDEETDELQQEPQVSESYENQAASMVPAEIALPRGRGRPAKVQPVVAPPAPSLRAQVVGQVRQVPQVATQPQVALQAKTAAVQAQELRMRQAQASKPQPGKVVTTGKGKLLALNNL
jgi:hypothetical protein